jgi:hypothetical protein
MTSAPFRRTLKWRPGDLFAVPLADRSFGLAQAVAPVKTHAIDFALLSHRFEAVPDEVPSANPRDVIGVRATWRTAVTGGHWGKVGSAALTVVADDCPNQRLLQQGQVEVEHSSWGLVEDFLSSWHGLLPWNLNPAFDFDRYLMPGTKRPSTARILSPAELVIFRASDKRGYAV